MRSEAVSALSNVQYKVQCGACNGTFEMSATDYAKQVGSSGVKCKLCGQKRAWRIGDAGFDPDQFREEADKLSTAGEVRMALEPVVAEIAQLEEQLNKPEVSGDAAKAADVRLQLNKLRAKRHALDLRWDEITSR